MVGSKVSSVKGQRSNVVVGLCVGVYPRVRTGKKLNYRKFREIYVNKGEVKKKRKRERQITTS